MESIQAIWTSFDVIVDVLQQITNNADQQTQMQAVGLRKRMLLLDFVAVLMFMKNITYKTKCLVVIHILDAISLVQATLSIMEKIQADDKVMVDQMESSLIFARSLNIDPVNDFNRNQHPRRAPRRLDEQAKMVAVVSLQQLYRMQFREVLAALT